MELLIGLIIAIIVIGILVWAARALIGAFGIPQPWATVLYVLVVLVALVAFLKVSGLRNFI